MYYENVTDKFMEPSTQENVPVSEKKTVPDLPQDPADNPDIQCIGCE